MELLMRDENPLHWSIRDLRRPDPECQMPEPIRPPDSGKVLFTCPHCQITFILVQQRGDNGWEEVWVNAQEHAAMIKAQNLLFEREEKRPERFTAFDYHKRII
jgi:hypothetical protein